MLSLKILFVIFGILYVLSVILHKIYFSKLKDNVKISNFVALMTLFLLLYIIFGLILVLFVKGIFYKTIVLLFAMSPFIIGKVAVYEKEKIFTTVQFISIFISIIFILLC